MRIEVSVPGIRKERGKLPAPTTLAALRLALPLVAGPPICGEPAGPALGESVIAGEVGAPLAIAHPVSPNTTRSTRIRLISEPHLWQPSTWRQTAARWPVSADCVT
jgi:hypothetical protein